MSVRTAIARCLPTLAALAAFAFLAGPAWSQPLNVAPTNDLASAGGSPTNDPALATMPDPAMGHMEGETNFVPPSRGEQNDYMLAVARYQAKTRDFVRAEQTYVKLLADGVADTMRRTALFEMADAVRQENDLPRAQAIYTQYLQRWPGDVRTPEVYLHQGQVFRQMDLPDLALAKFYGVMTTALALTNNQLPYYKGLVLQAQVEIAETHYLAGEFKDAVDYYSRLLKQNDPALDREQIQFRLIRSLEAIKHHDEAVDQAQDFLAHYPDSLEEPEVRYHLAQAYKSQNRGTEALQEIKLFLKEERNKTTNDPAVWAYWQQRVGNEIGNQLYQEGDYVKALQVYLALSQLDASASWQVPVRYQIGLTYEKLMQPRLAMEVYRNILTNSVPNTATNLAPSLKSVLDMADWRLKFLEWDERAQPFVHPAVAASETNTNSNLPKL